MKIQEIEQLITKYNEAYYNEQSLVEDSVYDELQNQLKEIDPNNNLLKQVGQVIRSTQWPTGSHKLHMGSLFKATNLEEIKTWLNKHPKQLYVIEEKYDGLSISLDYVNGVFTKATTRGEGIEGEIITPNVIKMDFPKILKTPVTISLRGEIICTHTNFNKINELVDKKFSNPRNGVSGISRNTNGKFCEYLSIVVYDCNIDTFQTEFDKVNYIRNLGFKLSTVTAYTFEEVESTYNMYMKYRPSLDYDIDGLVIKINDLAYAKTLGYTDDRPKFQIALKFPAKTHITKVVDIQWQIGRTGRYTPIAIIEPVNIDGREITKASVHNIEQIHKLKVIPGSVIEIGVHGDVIPQVDKVIENFGLYETPTEYNGVPLIRKGPNLFLSQDNDIQVVKQITHYIKSLGIEEISEKSIQKIFDKGLITNIADLYILTEDKLTTIEGFATKSARYFIETIKKYCSCQLENFVNGLSIDGLTSFNIKRIIEFKGKKELENIVTNTFKLPEIDFNQETIDKINSSLEKRKEVIKKILPYIKFRQSDDTLRGKSFCITGKLSKERNLYINIVKERGGEYKSSLSRGITYLISNDINSTSTKKIKAKEYNIKIINENEFIQIIGGVDVSKSYDLW